MQKGPFNVHPDQKSIDKRDSAKGWFLLGSEGYYVQQESCKAMPYTCRHKLENSSAGC